MSSLTGQHRKTHTVSGPATARLSGSCKETSRRTRRPFSCNAGSRVVERTFWHLWRAVLSDVLQAWRDGKYSISHGV